MIQNYYFRSAGYLEIQTKTIDSNIRVNAPLASFGLQRRSININKPISLGPIYGFRPQQKITRAIFTNTHRSLVSEKVIGDFNFATDALDKSPPHNNNEKICEKWIEIIEKHQLTDK